MCRPIGFKALFPNYIGVRPEENNHGSTMAHTALTHAMSLASVNLKGTSGELQRLICSFEDIDFIPLPLVALYLHIEEYRI